MQSVTFVREIFGEFEVTLTEVNCIVTKDPTGVCVCGGGGWKWFTDA